MTGWAWTAEHGPELVRLPDGAQVIPLPEPPEPEASEDRP